MKVKSLSRVRLSVTPWTVAHHTPLSMGFSRQEYWSGLPCPHPGDLPDQGIGPVSLISPALAGSLGFCGGSDSKESACNKRDLGLIPGLGRSPGGRHGSPFQYSCLENPKDRGAWQATVHGVAKSQTRLSDFTHTHTQRKMQ